MRYWEQCEGCGEEVRWARGPRDGLHLCATCRRAHTRAERRRVKQVQIERAARAALVREPQAGEHCGRCGGLLVWDCNGFTIVHDDPAMDTHLPVAGTGRADHDR